ncbi:PKD domain-containing protein [Gimesia algae]|nr:PKD domain-containing protein [Gimesia algae]
MSAKIFTWVLMVVMLPIQYARADESQTKTTSLRDIQKQATLLKRRGKSLSQAEVLTKIAPLKNALAFANLTGAPLNRLYTNASDSLAMLCAGLDLPVTDRFEKPTEIEKKSNSYRVRIACLTPADRTPNAAAAHRAAELLLWYQRWFADQMAQNGHGKMTFSYESETGSSWPRVHNIRLPRPSVYYRTNEPGQGDKVYSRVVTAAKDVGIPVEESGQVWILFIDMQEILPDGKVVGLHRQGGGKTFHTGATVCDTGTLGELSLTALTTDNLYHGMVVPSLGRYPLKRGVSFPPSRGNTVGTVVSSNLGSWLHELGHCFLLTHDFRNDDNAAGNLMGNGLRGFRAWLYPEKFQNEYTHLSANTSNLLRLNRFFRPQEEFKDTKAPSIEQAKFSTQSVEGLLVCSVSIRDDDELAYVMLMNNDCVVASQDVSGKNAQVELRFWRYEIGDNRWQLRVFDRSGNVRILPGTAFVPATSKRAAHPYVTCPKMRLKAGEPLSVSAEKTKDPDGDSSALRYAWDFEGDGKLDTEFSPRPHVSVTYPVAGVNSLQCHVMDGDGTTAVSSTIRIQVEQ